MKRNILIIGLLISGTGALMAQAPGTKRLGSTYLSNDTSAVMDIREKLVQLALQNPNFELADRKLTIAEYELMKAKGEWMAAIAPNLNLNEFTINTKGSNQFYPLWNVGITVPLNYFTQHKYATKIARENILIAAAEKNDKYRQIRTRVLTRYEDFLMYKEMLDLQNRVTQDAYLAYRQKESDFKDDLLGVEEYNKAFSVYKEQQDHRIQAQRNLNVAKLELEEMIGISMDDLLQQMQQK